MGIETMRVSESARAAVKMDWPSRLNAKALSESPLVVGQASKRPCRACAKIHHHQTWRLALAPYEVSEQHGQLAGWINAQEDSTEAGTR